MCALLRYLLGQGEGFFESCGSASSSSLPPFPFQGFLEKYPFKLDRSLSLFLPFLFDHPRRFSTFRLSFVPFLSSPCLVVRALHHRKLRFCGGTNAPWRRGSRVGSGCIAMRTCTCAHCPEPPATTNLECDNLPDQRPLFLLAFPFLPATSTRDSLALLVTYYSLLLSFVYGRGRDWLIALERN